MALSAMESIGSEVDLTALVETHSALLFRVAYSVLREMERLPKGERHVLLLSAVEELETAEMAKVLGRSESAVRALLFRARTRLKQRLEKGGKA